MNEISILMHLLSNKIGLHQVGATEEQVLQALNITGKNRTYYFQDLLTNLSKYIEPLGLEVKYNPIDSHWFLSFDSEISDTISANPFEGKPRLAATLFCVLVCCLQNAGIGKIQDIKKLRNKKKIMEDLKELEQFGYIEILKNASQIQLTPLIGYQLNMEKLFIKMALKLKKLE
ncbi:MAG: hypothetical protein EU529_07450 [Promethearchaeota archaeon]|nr:MAG: hypothetical protein EU529_07450 [Candidatus Lokiarchaeota archaeon]